MALEQGLITDIRDSVISKLDDNQFISFFNNNTFLIAKQVTDPVKSDVSAGTIDWDTVLGLGDQNGSNITKVGVTSDTSNSKPAFTIELVTSVNKTDSIELAVGLRANINVTG